MRNLPLLTCLLSACLVNPVFAGSLINGEWKPGACGEKPATPKVNSKNVDDYNESVKAINDWQQKSNVYYGCIVTEANKDNAVIVDKANLEQNGYKQDFERISTELEAAKRKLGGE